MIEVIVKLVPFGDHSQEREIGHIEIVNVNDEVEYDAYAYRAWVDDFGDRIERIGRVRHHRKLNVFYLIGIVIQHFEWNSIRPDDV